jgi:hypothetical protein
LIKTLLLLMLSGQAQAQTSGAVCTPAFTFNDALQCANGAAEIVVPSDAPLSASTVTLSGRLDSVALSTASNGTILMSLAASTTTLSASTVAIYGLVVNVGASTNTIAVAVAASTTTLFSVRASSGINNDITNLKLINTIASAVTYTSSITITSSGGLGVTGPVSILNSALHASTFTVTGIFTPPAWTIAQMRAYTVLASEVGGLVMCSNCAAGWMVCKTTGPVKCGFQLSTGVVTSPTSSPCQ